MRAGDTERVADLCEQLGYPVRAGEVGLRLAALAALPDHCLLVAESGGDVLGWIHVRNTLTLESTPWAEVDGLVVDARWRGRGVGTRLLDDAERWARERGLAEIRLRSNVIRAAAHQFYRARGYEVVKTQLNFRKRL